MQMQRWQVLKQNILQWYRQTSVSHKTVKLTDTQQTYKTAGMKKCQDIKPHNISKEKVAE